MAWAPQWSGDRGKHGGLGGVGGAARRFAHHGSERNVLGCAWHPPAPHTRTQNTHQDPYFLFETVLLYLITSSVKARVWCNNKNCFLSRPMMGQNLPGFILPKKQVLDGIIAGPPMVPLPPPVPFCSRVLCVFDTPWAWG